jgi:Kef-type K+ transport system membrane component KefB
MNRIDFVGNALFIPFFLIGVGMLVDFSVLFKRRGAIKVAATMITIAVVGKYLFSSTFNTKDVQIISR